MDNKSSNPKDDVIQPDRLNEQGEGDNLTGVIFLTQEKELLINFWMLATITLATK